MSPRTILIIMLTNYKFGKTGSQKIEIVIHSITNLKIELRSTYDFEEIWNTSFENLYGGAHDQNIYTGDGLNNQKSRLLFIFDTTNFAH